MTFFELKKYMLTELSAKVKELKKNKTIKDEENFSPSFDVSVVLRDILNLSKTEYYAGRDFDVAEDKRLRAMSALDELKALKPVQYITGKCEFMSLEFLVNESTLIPRPETEVLTEHILEYYTQNTDKYIQILDIGTGSGCIAVSLVHYLKNARAVCADISEKALDIARQNAQRHGLDDRITFISHDILNGFPQLDTEFDCVVSNPPYIKTDVIPALEANVRDYEPISALDGGKDGLIFYKAITASCRLKDKGLLAFETGYDQGKAVSLILADSGKFENIRIIKDLSGNDRVVSGIFRSV